MANINSLSSNSYSSSSSIYGNKNIISGLATGMDTETMIENSVQPYQTKIIELQQQQERLTWKQDAYRELIDQMNGILNKYTSYSSTTNLSSNAFFTKAAKTVAGGANASAVTASGTAQSDIQISEISQLAKGASYAVTAGALGYSSTANLTGSAIQNEGTQTVSKIDGSLTITAGKTKYELTFGVDEVYDDAEALTKAINSKLKEQNANVEATYDSASGKISFAGTSNGDSAYISGASGNFRNNLGVKSAASSAASDRFDYKSIEVGDKALKDDSVEMHTYLSDKTVEVTLNGVTKKLSVGQLEAATEGNSLAKQIADNLQTELNKAFGDGEVTVSAEDGKLSFGVKANTGSSLLVSSDTKALGIGNGLSSYFNSGRTLGDLLGENYFKEPLKDADGNVLEGQYATDEKGDSVYEKRDLVINGVTVGSFDKDSSMDSVMTAINSSAAGVKVSFSKLTGEFVFSTTGTGANQQIEFGEGLGSRLFEAEGEKASESAGYTAGQDAKVKALVNNREVELTRSSNAIEMDGMTVTLKETFKAETSSGNITFTRSSDSDKVVDTLKTFVEDVNKLMKDLHSAYSTQPLTKSKSSTALATSKSGTSYYMPLTEEDKEGMSETAIKNYEEKAKQGLLFQDTDVSNLYDRLRSVLTDSSIRKDLEAIGITTDYSSGVTTLSLNEDKLRSALESDPDKVRTVFTRTVEGGSSSNGLMEQLKSPLKTYGSISLGSQGVLVRKAGTKLSSVSMLNNTIQTQISNYDKQIESWQSKMSAKIDYYTKQFTALEKLMSTMNSQSSMLSQMMGY